MHTEEVVESLESDLLMQAPLTGSSDTSAPKPSLDSFSKRLLLALMRRFLMKFSMVLVRCVFMNGELVCVTS